MDEAPSLSPLRVDISPRGREGAARGREGAACDALRVVAHPPAPSLWEWVQRWATLISCSGLVAFALAACSGTHAGSADTPAATDRGDAHSLRNTDTARPVQPPIAVMLARRAGPSVESIEPWTFAGSAGVLVQTRHYRVYSTLTDPVLMDRLPGFLEQALEHYRSAFAPPASRERLAAPPASIKLETYVLRTRAQWEDLTRSLAGPSASTLLRVPRGGYAWGGKGVFYGLGVNEEDAGPSPSQATLVLCEQRETFAIAAHEGWHQYTQRTFAQPLPAWLEEGLATCMEGFEWVGGGGEGASSRARFDESRNPPRLEALRELAATKKLLRLEELLDTSPAAIMLDGRDAKALAYYAQAWALCRWLDEDPVMRESLWRLLKDAQTGALNQAVTTAAEKQAAAKAQRSNARQVSSLMLRRGPAVFVAYFGEDIDAHERAYRAYVERLVQSN